MKALVLGGTGFIGSHVVDRLLAEGHSVRVFAAVSERYRSPLPHVDYRIASFDDLHALAEALEGIEVVFHLISTTVPATSNTDPVSDVRSNLIGSINLLNLMVEKAIPRIVFSSSGGTVYGVPESIPVTETHPLRPICSYGVVKVAIENYITMFSQLYGLEFVILRAANPFGERQGYVGIQGIIGTAFEKALKGESITVWGNGGSVRDYIYVDDLARLFTIAGSSEYSGVFNAGCGIGRSVHEVLSAVEEVSGILISKEYLPPRAFDIPNNELSIKKARDIYGWIPEIDFIDGLRRTWNWYLKQVDSTTKCKD